MRNLFPCLLVLFLVSCVSKTKVPKIDSRSVIQKEEIVQSLHPDTILITRLDDGRIHEYYQVYSDYSYNLRTRIKGEENDEVIRFTYYRYENSEPFYTDGFMAPISYVLKNKNHLYIISDICPNSDGWVTEYQIFKVDLKTNKTKFLVDCAAVEAVSDGFIVAQARLTNEDTAKCTADEIWLMHDEKINFDGKVVSVSDQEYDYATMERRFSSDHGNQCLKGIKSCSRHIEY